MHVAALDEYLHQASALSYYNWRHRQFQPGEYNWEFSWLSLHMHTSESIKPAAFMSGGYSMLASRLLLSRAVLCVSAADPGS